MRANSASFLVHFRRRETKDWSSVPCVRDSFLTRLVPAYTMEPVEHRPRCHIEAADNIIISHQLPKAFSAFGVFFSGRVQDEDIGGFFLPSLFSSL